MKLKRRFYLNHWLDPEKRAALFLGAIFTITCTAVLLLGRELILTKETLFLSLAWLAGFGFLFLNVAYLFVLSISHLFLKTSLLKEAYIKIFPKIALVYPVRNEKHGLYERINFSLEGNKLPNLDLWILSDSDSAYEAEEQKLVSRLREKYADRVHYRRREVPVERKQGNLKEFLHSHQEYTYIYVADADGMVPKGVILKLLRKAEHSKNLDIVIFQCFIKIAHARTWYAHFERIGTNLAQRFNFIGIQALLERSISFGHHHLARTHLLRNLRLPPNLLSHDNWDTALLDEMGYRVAICPDVCAFDEAPSNYLEARERAARWAQGTLQGWPLIFRKKISLASRFLAAYGIYLYLADIVFFFWVILGMLSHSELTGELIHFEIDSIWHGFYANSVLNGTLLFSMAVVFFHKITILRSWRDLRDALYEILISTLITLNNFIYAPLDALSIPLKKLQWIPMKKDPLAEVSLKRVASKLWIGTVFGLAGIYFCTRYTPYFVWQATLILISLSLSIPAVYLSAERVPSRLRNLI